ncbi:hypothetical protein Droror1_Dr00001140 [Drosera rotundifolia]
MPNEEPKFQHHVLITPSLILRKQKVDLQALELREGLEADDELQAAYKLPYNLTFPIKSAYAEHKSTKTTCYLEIYTMKKRQVYIAPVVHWLPLTFNEPIALICSAHTFCSAEFE